VWRVVSPSYQNHDVVSLGYYSHFRFELTSFEYKELKSIEKDLFKKIYDLRDKYAQELNFPPNVVIAKEFMFKIASKKIDIEHIVFDKKVSERYRKQIISSLKEIV